MDTNHAVIEYDNLSVKIFSELAGHAIENIAGSANEMLDVACLFFDRDVSEKIMEFQKLYQTNTELDKHKNDIDEQVDKLVEAVQKGTLGNGEGVDSENSTNSEHCASDPAADLTKLSNIQKNLEALIQQDEKIKQRLVPVMQCMQYEDLIVNRIHRLIDCWANMVQLLNDDADVDMQKALASFDPYLSSEDEYSQFYSFVLERDYSSVAYCNLTKECTDNPHSIRSVNDLAERFFKFSQNSLNECVRQTQAAFEELMKLLQLVSGSSDEVKYLFSGNEDLLENIHTILLKNQDTAFKDSRTLLKEMMSFLKKHNEEEACLLGSFTIALQSQDRIRQNIENITKFHELWSKDRENFKQRENFTDDDATAFGNKALSLLTSDQERQIIQTIIPTVEYNDEEDDEDDLFF